MRVSRGRVSGMPSTLQSSNFTGDVWVDPVLVEPSLVAVNHVFFAPSSRTHWHSHRGGQVLHVTNGSGLVSSRAHGAVAVGAGDVVWSDPDDIHWHGAAEDTYLVHTAISLADTVWLAAVTDEEYVTALRNASR